MNFIDQAKIVVAGGRGGDGCLSFRREKYIEMGGPDGGTGGKGGDVWLVADSQKNTLYDFTYKPVFRAEPGGHGLGKNMTGRSGEDLVIRLPPGTLVFEEGHLKADLKSPGDRYLAAHGGRGGRGNASFKTAANTAPRISEKGSPPEEKTITLELKLLADVGLIGFPNAGKSTFLSVVTQARPKIADYAFTTLTPNLGVCSVGGRHFVIADIPGLIEGAHEGRGLGDAFLRHIERTRVLIHLVDVFGFDGKTAAQNKSALDHELTAYSSALAKKPQILAATKMDLTGSDKALAVFRRHLKRKKVYPVSAATSQGIKELLNAVAKALDTAPPPPVFAPPEVEHVLLPEFDVEARADGGFRLFGPAIDRLTAITHFEQDEAVARLQKIFKKMGVEQALDRLGAQPGDRVTIGESEFTYRPDKPRAPQGLGRQK